MNSVPLKDSGFNPKFSVDEIFRLIDRFRMFEFVSRELEDYWLACSCSDVISSLYKFIASEVNFDETQNETE